MRTKGQTGDMGTRRHQDGSHRGLGGLGVPPHLDGVALVLVVLGVGLEVVDVDGGQPGDEQLQLLLREDGDEALRDDLIETLQEGGQLLPDGPWGQGDNRGRSEGGFGPAGPPTCPPPNPDPRLTGHAHLADEVHVLLLVLLGHQHIGSVGFQVPHLAHPKLLHLGGGRGGVRGGKARGGRGRGQRWGRGDPRNPERPWADEDRR